MFFDILWNLFRKSLGNSFYNTLKSGPLGRPENYYTISTFDTVFTQYVSTGFNFNHKQILEVGGGNQFYTAFHFLSEGADRILLADPVFNNETPGIISRHREEFLKSHPDKQLPVPAPVSSYSSLDAIPEDDNSRCDFICSHFVLEHFRELDSYFLGTRRLLSDSGISFNIVDLSDHIYHVFNTRPRTQWLYRSRMLYHLRYSDAFYDAITDRRIWVNRLLLPAYRACAEKYDLVISDIEPLPYLRKVKIHPDVLQRNPTTNREELFITHFSFRLQKR